MASDLDDIKNEQVDLVSNHTLFCYDDILYKSFIDSNVCVDVQEKIPMEEVFEQLKCSKDGLSSDEGAKRLAIFGPNKLEEKKASLLYFSTIS